METLAKPEVLDALSKLSAFTVLAIIAGLVIYALLQNIKNAGAAATQQSEETKLLINLLTDNTKAFQGIENALKELARTNAQSIGAIEAQGVLASQISNNLVVLEKSFRDHNNAVAETLGVLSTNIVDLEGYLKRRMDELFTRIDALPIEVGVVVKEHIAVMLLQSTPPPKVITGEVRAAILDGADKKPRVMNGAVTDESQKGVD